MKIQEWLGEDNTLGIDIWENKYQRNGENFEQWLDRVSGGNEDVKELIEKKQFLFGGRILSNRGVEDENVSYSNCYVISPPEDNLESIYETCKKLARTYSYGGGCGTDISKLAPEGAKVHNQAKCSTGAVSFMDTFSQVTEQIGQKGRRGALMISIDCNHPDLEKFITVKSDLGKVTAANISVRVSDDFMNAVKHDLDWNLSFTRPETEETISKTVKAKELFRKLAENNWDYAEPGILFWDNIESWNLLSNNPDFEYAGTNPCGEEPLPAGGSCLLGALNLSEFVVHNKFDYESFDDAVKVAVKALNDVLDEGLPKHPLQEQRDSVRDWRQIGLGIMGIADMLIKLGMEYGSDESIMLCQRIGHHLCNTAIYASAELAKEHGAYPKYTDAVMDTEFFNANASMSTVAMVECYGLRNSQLLTIAPTGTISTMLGVSGGIEPIFANSYTRLTKSLHGEDVSYKVYTPIVAEYMKKHGITDENKLPNYFVTSADIPVLNRIKMQAVWQNHIDASISSTVNLANEVTVEDVENLYMAAWEHKLKGITVYRAGCAREGILTASEGKDTAPTQKSLVEASRASYDSLTPISRKIIGETSGTTYCKKCACGTLYITVNQDKEGNVVETFVNTSKGGICQANVNALNRMISVGLRSGVKVIEICDQLKGITCPACVKLIGKGEQLDGISCSDILGKTLLEFYEITHNMQPKNELFGNENCPECGATLIQSGGCKQCLECGWSKCD